MNRPAMLMLCVLALPVAAAAAEPAAVDGAALAKASRCQSCHHATDVLIGPPWQAIAIRYAQDREAMAPILARKIVLGGGANWGVVPMVPNQHVTPQDAAALARWVLAQLPR
jgi:cytochrome c